MASGDHARGEFRGGGYRAHLLSIGIKAAGHQAARTNGPIFAASILRTPAILFRGTHADGQRFHAERLEATWTADRHLYGHAAHGDTILEE